MLKRLDHTLTKEGLAIVQHAIKYDPCPKVRQRALGLRLLHEGQLQSEVVHLMSVCLPTVYSWCHR